MSKNYIFRKFECGLSKEETAKLCFKTVRTVTGWDNGKDIPPECRRLMRMVKSRELSQFEEWRQFKMVHNRLELPTGEQISPQELLTAIALLSIKSDLELATAHKLLKLAKAISKINEKRSR